MEHSVLAIIPGQLQNRVSACGLPPVTLPTCFTLAGQMQVVSLLSPSLASLKTLTRCNAVTNQCTSFEAWCRPHTSNLGLPPFTLYTVDPIPVDAASLTLCLALATLPTPSTPLP